MRARRDYFSREIARLDPAVDYRRIYTIMYAHEFPWDMNQSLSLALYRTYAVPSIGNLLAGTAELQEQTQKRYSYYADLGRHMGINNIPQKFDDFARLLDEYERKNFAPSSGGRAVSEATLTLMESFPLHSFLPAPVSRHLVFCLLEDHLLDAFGYRRPSRAARFLVRLALRARSAYLRHRPPRLSPAYFRDSPLVRSYPDGWSAAALGTEDSRAAGKSRPG